MDAANIFEKSPPKSTIGDKLLSEDDLYQQQERPIDSYRNTLQNPQINQNEAASAAAYDKQSIRKSDTYENTWHHKTSSIASQRNNRCTFQSRDSTSGGKGRFSSKASTSKGYSTNPVKVGGAKTS